MTRLLFAVIALLSTISLIHSNPAYSDQAGSVIEEILVTASLQPITDTQTGNAVTVIDSEQLRNRSPMTVSELMRDIPGLAVSQSGVLGSATQIRVRGAEANHLLVLIDGVEANDPSQGDELNWGTLTAGDIERIEVMRGPQSALYGSDALAGVVNIITRRATEPFSANVFVESGTSDTQYQGASFGLRRDLFGIQVGATLLDSKGENISREGSEEDGYSNKSVSLKGDWAPLDELTVSFSGRQNDGRSEFDSVDFDNTGLPIDADVFSEFRNTGASVKVDYSMLGGQWQHRLAFSQMTNDNENFFDGLANGSTSSRKKQVQYVSSVYWQQDRQRLSVLLERETEDYRQRGPISLWGDDPNQNLSRDTDGVAIEYRGRFMDTLTLAASGRLDDNSDFEDSETYRLEAAYQVSETTRVRAAYGSAIKRPTFSERFGFYANSAFFPFLGNPDLKPEESTSWELGLDQSLLDDRLLLSLTWFDAELRDEIDGFVWDPDRLMTTADNLDGTSEREGAELAINVRAGENLRVSATYTYIDSTQQNASGQEVNELRRPRHLTSLNIAWQPMEALHLNVNVHYNGAQDDLFFPPWPLPSQVLELDGHTLLDVTVDYDFSTQLNGYLRLNNVLDEKYEQVYGYQTQGFGAHVGLRYNFKR